LIKKQSGMGYRDNTESGRSKLFNTANPLVMLVVLQITFFILMNFLKEHLCLFQDSGRTILPQYLSLVCDASGPHAIHHKALDP